MPRISTLATVGTLSIAGALAGVQLGRGAIADIDPFFFTPLPESRFYADLVPAGYNPAPAPSLSEVDEVWANNLNVSGRRECIDCGTFVERVELASGFDDLPPAAEAVQTYATPVAEGRDHLPGEVERYAYFPVTQEEAAQPRRDQFGGPAAEEEAAAEGEPELLNM